MPTPSKFNEETRTKITQALSVGASRRTAAAIAGVDEAQVRRWIKKGQDAAAGTRFREFYEAVNLAEASPKMRALGIVYKELPDNPGLAWKFIERTEQGYAPPQPNAIPAAVGPTVIHLSFATTGPQLVENEIIEGEVVDEQHSLPDSASSE